MKINKTYSSLLDKSIASMLAAIEIYNKPNFAYREDSFAILSVNAWELLLKAIYLRQNRYKMYSLYELVPKKKKDGTSSKMKVPVQNRTGNPKTLSIEKIIELLKQADIVVTNPPFSLFREYIGQLMEYEKKFLIVGHQNAIHYKEIFPWIMNNDVWLGYGFKGAAAHFYSPYDDIATAGEHKKDMIRVSGVNWFTNLEIPKRHEFLDLVCRYSPEEYPTYENYDAIEVGKVSDIPYDYVGVMGVPTTFIDKYNPEQFEIIGLAEGELGKELGLKPFDRELKKLNKSLRDGQVFYIKNGMPQKPYSRILIRNKHPQ